MRRIADLQPREAKTDARDAFIITTAARTAPYTLRAVQIAGEEQAELSMLCGFDDDLAQQSTAVTNRIRGLLTQIQPAPEGVLGPLLNHPAVLELLRTCPTPGESPEDRQKRIAAGLRKPASKMFIQGSRNRTCGPWMNSMSWVWAPVLPDPFSRSWPACWPGTPRHGRRGAGGCCVAHEVVLHSARARWKPKVPKSLSPTMRFVCWQSID
jgi:hypothetical protein